MPEQHFILLYVDHPERSAAFYTGLLTREPLEVSATFAMFALGEGVMLGLWSRHTVLPAAQQAPGSGELAFAMSSDAVVHQRYAAWSKLGVTMLQTPTRLDFGETFLAQDLDGNRLRVFAPAG